MLICECGINHQGSLIFAKELINVAKDCGADVVKFQKRNPDICVPESQKNIVKDTIFGEMKYINYKYVIEFGKDEYDEIDRYCKEIGIKWTASVWDIDSLNFICQYDVPFIKIASACITDIELLKEVKKKNIPVIISVGMSNKDEIDKAVEILGDNLCTIMYCKSAYPSNESELNLNTITYLKENYPYRIGYSSHDTVFIPILYAHALGAETIEVHITLDKNMKGTDHKSSFSPKDLQILNDILKEGKLCLGDVKLECTESEKPFKEKLRLK